MTVADEQVGVTLPGGYDSFAPQLPVWWGSIDLLLLYCPS
jgi:hypothetical protein